MSGGNLIVIFHFDGDFEFDIIRPLYKGGKQKMRFIQRNITFNSLVNLALEASNWEENSDNICMDYLHHNGHVFSLVAIEDDNDIRCMLSLSRDDTNGIYLYIRRRRLVRSAECLEKQARPHCTEECLIRDNQLAGTGSRRNLKGKVIHEGDAMHSTVNLDEDNDFHFSSRPILGSDEVGDEVGVNTSGVLQDGFDAAKTDEDIPDGLQTDGVDVAEMDVGFACPGRSFDVSTSHRGIGLQRTLNVGERSIPRSDVIFEDNMAPKEFITDVDLNRPREIWLGREFPDREDFRRSLAKFAIYTNFTLEHIRTSQVMVIARCKDPVCPWRIHASMIESGPRFKVRKYNPVHKCSKPLMGTAHPQASSNLIAEYILDKVRLNNSIKPKEIMDDFQMEFGVTISYRKAHIAKETALHIVRGSYEDSFKMLPLYCAELTMTNPGTVTNICTTDDDRFKRFFWAFGQCIQSFNSSLRPMAAVDGTHLRGKYPGVLLVAVTVDANNKLFPIAFAIAESERRDSWEWFLANLSSSLGHPTNLTIISDRQKGLVPALANIIPSATHCYCCRHLGENIKSNFCDSAIQFRFWCAAKAYRACEHEAFMEDIKMVNVDAYNYINAFGRHHWANAFVGGRRYDMLTSNAAEVTNNMLKDIRVLPIVKQVEEIRAKLMDFFQKRHSTSLDINSRLTPYAEKHLSQETEEARRLHVRVAGLNEFQVQPVNYVDVVRLDARTCTCRKWDALGIPCSHAIASMRVRNYNPYDFCEDWFLTSVYRSTYDGVIHATRDSKQWEHISTERVLPPIASKQLGRPKKNRRRTEDRYRQRRVMTCSHCRQRGHNRQSCRNPPPQ